MEITWFGHSCFRLTERNCASVVTDPFDSSLGYSLPRSLKADIVTVSHEAPGHNNLAAVKEARPITGPGEFEIGNVFITGIATSAAGDKKKKDSRKNTLYVFDFDGLTVAHLGDLDHVPAQSQIEDLGTVAVALVPVGGGGALNAAQAAEVISLIEPSIVVPMHYKTPETGLKLDPLTKFLKEMGLTSVKTDDSLTVKKGSLPDETHVVVLEYKKG
jgi:L-ascorbate metabolism protein UlaG (beta-lactamase superfamily)